MQHAFAAALLDPTLPPPAALPDDRFAVYRNNVMAGLTAALATGFPATQSIVGAEFFAAMAQAYIRRHPPVSPVLLHYGDSLGDFIGSFAPAAALPYLPDVARLEAAYTRSFHAADIVPLAAGILNRIDAQRLGDLQAHLHPAVAVIRSHHPVATIWAMNTGGLPLAEIADWQPEDALVHRPGMTVTVQRLLPGQAAFILALRAGGNMAAAATAAFAETESFDLAAALALLFGHGLIIHLDYAP